MLTAYDYGKIIEVCSFDETGAAENPIELDFDGTVEETLEAAGYVIVGEWINGAVSVEEV